MPVNKMKRENGYGEKLQVKVITVDKGKRRVECATRDGAMIWAAVWETGTVFRWPEVGETWTVRKDTGIWRMDAIVTTKLGEEESEHFPATLAELPEGASRIIGEEVYMANVNAMNLEANTVQANGVFYDYGIVTELPEKASIGQVCTFRAGSGVYWRLVYTKETVYPWAKIGGPPLRFMSTETLATAVETPVATKAPSLNSPLAMEAWIRYGAIRFLTPSAGFAYQQLFIAGIAFGNGCIAGPAVQTSPNIEVGATLVKSAPLEIRYQKISGTGNAEFVNPFVFLDPVRVG